MQETVSDLKFEMHVFIIILKELETRNNHQNKYIVNVKFSAKKVIRYGGIPIQKDGCFFCYSYIFMQVGKL